VCRSNYQFEAWAQFYGKMWGGQLDVKPIESSDRCGSEVL